jgi:hypothetical protein
VLCAIRGPSLDGLAVCPALLACRPKLNKGESRVKLMRGVATAVCVAFVSLSTSYAAPGPGVPNPAVYSQYPTRYSPSGVPEYGRVGGENYAVAGIINAGEPSIRVVYDDAIPGAHESAMSTLVALQASFAGFPQPGVIDGLHEVAYTAHYDGVQAQVYSAVGVSPAVSQAFNTNGLPLLYR